ncbi:MAG: hypothetical protein KBC81_00910 [Candidatus Pacebacteria bacterium]|nr:hypothetical protein [Candidatus Paceibacterota bacterium]
MRFFVRLVVLALVTMSVIACAGKVSPQVAPNRQVYRDAPNLRPAPMPVVPSCWDPRLRGNHEVEWYDNTLANVPVMFIITDRISGVDVCFGVVRPGGKQLGPATWSHWSLVEQWKVTGTHYVPTTNAARTEGLIDDRSVRLEYVRNYGWQVASVK